MDLKEVEGEKVWTGLIWLRAQNRDEWQALMNILMNLQVSLRQRIS
jgi:hypothetical protein